MYVSWFCVTINVKLPSRLGDQNIVRRLCPGFSGPSSTLLSGVSTRKPSTTFMDALVTTIVFLNVLSHISRTYKRTPNKNTPITTAIHFFLDAPIRVMCRASRFGTECCPPNGLKSDNVCETKLKNRVFAGYR